MEPEGKTVEVQSVNAARGSKGSTDGDNRQLYATIAYYFPQYTLKDVEQLSYRDVALLIKTAQRIEAERMYNYTMIASAPQSKNGQGVKKLLDHFKKIFKE